MSTLPDDEPSWHDLTFHEPSPQFIRRGQMDVTLQFLDADSVAVYDYIRAYTEHGEKFARLQVKDIQTETVRDAHTLIHQEGGNHHTGLEDELRDFLNQREDHRVQLVDNVTLLFFKRHELF